MVTKKNNKVNIPMVLACILLCCVMISTHFVSGLYARYSSKASGEASARVIKFGDITLTETGDFYESNKLMMIPGVNLTKDVTVTFSGSESATYVLVEIDVTNQWKTDDSKIFTIDNVISWTVEDGWDLTSSANNKYVYSLRLNPNETLTKDVIKNNGEIVVSDTITKNQMATLTNIKIDIQAHVVQVGDFETAQAAWNSLNTNHN